MSAAPAFRQAVIVEPQRVEIVMRDLAALPPNSAVIKVESCGVCGSDLTMYRGYHPVIKPPIAFGHEVIGTLTSVNGAMGGAYALGDRVAFLPQVGCGECTACRRNEARLCAHMKLIGGQIPGGMADFVVVPIENLIRVPDNVPAVLSVLAEPLAVGVHAANRAPSLKGCNCLVQGCGPIGLLVAFVLRTHNPVRVTVLEVDSRRLDIARHFGFEVLSSAEESSEPFDVVFECVGGASPARQAVELVRADGVVVLVGVASLELTFSGILLQRQERMVCGSHMYRRGEFERALTLLADGVIPADPESLRLLFDRRGLSDVGGMLAELDSRSNAIIKLVVDF